MIAGLAIMVQSYLVLDEDNKTLNSNRQVLDWLVGLLNRAICTEDTVQREHGLVFCDMCVLQVNEALR